jgi:hypothetical protein
VTFQLCRARDISTWLQHAPGAASAEVGRNAFDASSRAGSVGGYFRLIASSLTPASAGDLAGKSSLSGALDQQAANQLRSHRF